MLGSKRDPPPPPPPPPQISKFMGPTWGPPVGPRWAPCWPHEPCYQGRARIYAPVKWILVGSGYGLSTPLEQTCRNLDSKYHDFSLNKLHITVLLARYRMLYVFVQTLSLHVGFVTKGTMRLMVSISDFIIAYSIVIKVPVIPALVDQY